MIPIIKEEIPFVRILIPLILGISIAFFTYGSWSGLMPIFYLIGFLFVLIICLLIGYNKFNIFKFRWLPGLLFNIFVLLAGYCITIIASQKLDESHFSKTQYEALAVKIVSEPKLTGDILRFETYVDQGFKNDIFYPASGKLLIALKIDTTSTLIYKYGDLIFIPANYNEIEGPYNPAEFNFKAYLGSHNIYQQAFINQNQISLLQQESGNQIIDYSLKLRQKLVLKYSKYIHNKDAASVASTLILGYRADLSKEVLNAYSKTGTMHVLSVSGMHVGIVFIVMAFLLKFMDRNKNLRLLKAIIMISLIWFYSIITGFSPSVCRSAMMLTFVIIGKAIHRSTNTYNLVAISAVLLLICNPYFLVDVGFQLSYLAVLGLIYLYPKIYSVLYVKNWLGNKVWEYIALSFSAQAATFPLSMYYFHQFPLYFLISNIFIIIPVVIIMYAGLLFLFIPWDSVLRPLGWLLEESILFTNGGLFYIENIPFNNIERIWISYWYYLLIYLLIFCLIFYFIFKHKVLIAISLAISLILTSNTSFKNIISQKQQKVIFYSLRKNTAIGFLDGSGAIALTDLALDDKTFLFSVKPSLDSSGVTATTKLNPGTPFSNSSIFTDGSFIQFKSWKLMIWDSTFNKKTFSKPLTVNAVLIRGNPKITILALKKSVNFDMIFIDGSNPDYKIRQWNADAEGAGLKCYVLKRNFAYTIDLQSKID